MEIQVQYIFIYAKKSCMKFNGFFFFIFFFCQFSIIEQEANLNAETFEMKEFPINSDFIMETQVIFFM